MQKILTIIGARPQFIKASVVSRAIWRGKRKQTYRERPKDKLIECEVAFA